MAYSESAMQGVKDHGKGWRKTIPTIKPILERLSNAIEREDSDAIDTELRAIGWRFAVHMTSENATGGEREALEWMQEESAGYEAENGLLHEFQQEFNYRLNELYDWADYNRIWVEPF